MRYVSVNLVGFALFFYRLCRARRVQLNLRPRADFRNRSRLRCGYDREFHLVAGNCLLDAKIVSVFNRSS